MKQPVFICSLARSGTHWLQRSLAQSPELVSIEGVNLILKFQEMIEWHQVLHEWPGSVWVKQNIGPVEFSEMLGRFYRDLMWQTSGGQRFVENSPELNVICFRLIHQIYPDAFFIFMYRDGRNYVASMEEFSLMKGKEFSFEPACKRWARIMDDFREIEQKLTIRNFMMIRYEDLLTSFDDVFEEVCSFVEIRKFRPESFEINTAFDSPDEFNLRWKALSAEKRRIFRKHAGQQLIDWGFAGSEDSWEQ